MDKTMPAISDLRRIASELQLQFRRLSYREKSKYIRIEVKIKPLQILPWLASQQGFIRLYWSDRKRDTEIGTLGAVDTIQHTGQTDLNGLYAKIESNLKYAPEGIRYMGGISFDSTRAVEHKWSDFGNYLFVIPRYEILQRDGDYFFSCNLLREEIDSANQFLDLRELETINMSLPTDIPFLLSRNYLPDRHYWQKMIRLALADIADQRYEKIVLARETALEFEDSIDPFQILQRLQVRNPDSIHFCFQPRERSAFLGSTPELLFTRHQNVIYSEAIAGTRRRGTDLDEDHYFENQLLQSSKDRKEHWFVIETIRKIMYGLCDSVENGHPVSILKLADVQHLITNIRGVLKSGITDRSILSQLHPTPAVGGFPTDKALARIAELEPFRRGWYAGPVGWISTKTSQFAVAIRSGLFQDRSLHLYSGAGIINGSDPHLEWEEIDTKIANFLHALDINGQIKERYHELKAAQ